MKWRSLDESTPGSDARTLEDILAQRKKLIAQYVPAETRAVHARVVSELKARRLALNSLPRGVQAPTFVLPDHSGHSVACSDLLARGRLVLCFFRGRWDPFCCAQLEALNRILPQIERSAASLAAISPQTGRQSFFMAEQHRLRFPLLIDAGNHVARQFGLVYRVPAEQQTIYRRAFINLPFVNGDESWELPIPATYIFERDATVLYAWANEEYTERVEPAEILEALR